MSPSCSDIPGGQPSASWSCRPPLRLRPTLRASDLRSRTPSEASGAVFGSRLTLYPAGTMAPLAHSPDKVARDHQRSHACRPTPSGETSAEPSRPLPLRACGMLGAVIFGDSHAPGIEAWRVRER